MMLGSQPADPPYREWIDEATVRRELRESHQRISLRRILRTLGAARWSRQSGPGGGTGALYVDPRRGHRVSRGVQPPARYPGPTTQDTGVRKHGISRRI